MVSSSFPAGSEVEVRSNEEGFKGAWFEATVLKPLPKYRRYTVSYASLVSDELTGKPLEDTVYCSFVRPRPPPRAAAGGFELHQIVEAYHNDGWWKGVVSKVPKAMSGLYRVCFPSSREELEFKGEELREQLDWAKGKWVAVKDREVDEDDIMFDMGSRVEVSRDKENYGAAWFVGTVLKVIGKNNFLVEYESLRVDNDGTSGLLLKEIVDLQYIRPSPPPASEFDNFVNILEEAEAFHKGGWVAGVVLELRRGSKYIIKSMYLEEEIELDRTAIRPRFEWTNEHWVRISQEKSSNTVSAMGARTYSRRRKSRAIKISSLPIPGPIFSGNDREFAGRSEGSSVKAKKSEEAKVEGGVGTSQPCKKLKKGKSLGEHLKLVDETNSVGRRRKRRSRTCKRSILSIAALSSRNNNGEVADRSAVVKLKDKKVESSIEEMINSSQPREKSEKGKSLEKHLQLLDSTLMNCGTKSPRMLRKRSSVGPILEGSTALVTRQTCSKRPRRRVGTKSAEHEKGIPKVNGNDSVNNVEGSSSCLGDVPENQSKAADFGHSPARGEPSNSLPIAGWGNHEADHGVTENTKTRRKKLGIWSSRHKRKTFDVDDVKQQVREETKQHAQEEMEQHVQEVTEERKRGRPPKKKISYMNGGEKGKSLEKHLRLLDSTLMNCGTRCPRMLRKRSSIGPMLEGNTALVTGQTCSKSPCRRVRTKSAEHEKVIPKVNGNDSVNNVEGSSSCLGNVPEIQSKAADFCRSPARGEPSDSLPVAGWGNHMVGHGVTENNKTQRKKLVIWSSRHNRKTLDVDDAKQQVQKVTKQHVQEEMEQHVQEKTKKRKRGRPPLKKISYVNVGTESQQLGEMKVVGGEDRTEFVESSKQTPTVDALGKVQSLCHDKVVESKNSLLTVNMDGYRPANDVTGICLYNMQVDIMDNSPESPQIDSSILVAKSLQYLTIQQSPILKSFNDRVVESETEAEGAEVLPSEEDIHDHDKLILNGLMNTVEMERSPIDPTPDGLSLLKEYNACDLNELNISGSLSGKAYVEIEDRAPIDHSPNGSSLSREYYVSDRNEFTPSRSLSEKSVIETEKVPNDLTPGGSSTSKEDVRDHDDLNPSGFPSEKAILDAEGRAEIYPKPSMSLSSEVALPFMKESSMWKIVDSMEVFCTTPQQPHFQPLEQYEVEYREGMAIGLMVTFANLVSSIQKLQITDSQDIFEEKLRALMPLGLHGFNIQFARSCLEKLLEIRSNVCQSEGKKGCLKERILETVYENEQIDAFIAAHDKIIQELEENLYRYKERRTYMILERNRKDSEIARLKMDARASEEAYFSAEEHFKAVANAPW